MTLHESQHLLAQHVQQRVALNEEELAAFVAAFRYKRVKKRQHIVQPDFVARHRNYVVRGALRAYVIAEGGHDHTIQFAIDDWWISDYNSYIFQRPATMFVMALEDCELLQLDYATEQRLKAENHRYETFFRVTAERSTAAMQRRIMANLTMDAEERYDRFLKYYGSIAERVPQYTVASYLNMSTEFLSRIRSRKAAG